MAKSPYQFYLEPSLKAKGIKKSKENNVPIAPFMVMCWEQFIDRPIEDSMRLLRVHNAKKKRKRKYKGVKVTL